MTAGADERRLLDEVARLEGQVELLVRAEQRMHRAQREREDQARQLGALAEFARSCSSGDAPGEILDRALAMLHAQVTLDVALALDLERGVARDGDAAAPAELSLGERAWLAGLRETVVAPWADEGALALPPGMVARAFAAVRGAGYAAVLPLRVGGVVAAVLALAAAASPRRTFRDDRLAPWHEPFLGACARSVERALENASLTAALAEANARLRETVRGLERAQHELVQARKMEAVGVLAGGVAHDFNNLLTVILNHATLVSDAQAPGSVAREDIARVLDAAGRAAEITGQLLAFGRKQVQRRERVDLREVSGSLARLLGSVLGETVTLRVRAEPDAPCVIADRSQVDQVLMNLVLNARDAMPDGGEIAVGVRAARADDLDGWSEAREPSRYGVLEVIDQGVGMDEATLARAFEPFFTRKAEGHGTGLGLAVVYGIVTQSEGRVTVDSAPGMGARFTVILPAADARPEPRGGPARPSRRAARGVVLLAEDDAVIRRVTARVLRAAGYAVLDAEDGEHALEVARTAGAIDLLVSDVVMPRMGGVDLAERLRRERPALRVLFISGYSPALLDTVRTERLAASYLAKPFTPESLLDRIDALLR